MQLYGENIQSRLLIGTALYPSPAVMEQALKASGAEIVTVSLRREAAGGKAGDAFWRIVSSLGAKILPNTAGCRTVQDAVTTAQMARELFGTPWIKLEVIGDDETLQPDVVGLVEAAAILVRDGFQVFPVLHGGPDRGEPADRRRLRSGHALGLAHRQRQGDHQPVWFENAARPLPRRDHDRGRRTRRALACG